MKQKAERNPEFYTLKSDLLTLKLIDFYEENGPEIPFYWYDIILNSTNQKVGKISIRIGHNYHSYYGGNIGYEVDKEFRGNHYALEACKMVVPVARAYGMTKIYLTCDEDNIASYKTMERFGAELEEIVQIPKDYAWYYDGIAMKRIYIYKVPTE